MVLFMQVYLFFFPRCPSVTVMLIVSGVVYLSCLTVLLQGNKVVCMAALLVLFFET